MVSQVRVKICGITTPEDAEIASQAGADAIGMVFYEKSPRHIGDFGLAREISLAAGPFVSVVALTVNSSQNELEQLLSSVPVSLLQFHGDEKEAFCSQFARPYVKALRMKEDMDVNTAVEEYQSSVGILLDTYVKGVPGGTGEAFNWDRVPENAAKPIILAGGLNPANVTTAIQTANPYAVDVSGGVEATPGKKDKEKVKEFIRKAKLEYIRDR